MESPIRPILHIEDEDNDVYLLQRALVAAELACPVQLAKTTTAACAYLTGKSNFAQRNYYPLPELILLDLTLPPPDGLDFLGWRRIHPAIRRIPVVVLTASRGAEEVQAAYDAGANGFLSKPAHFAEWIEMIHAIRVFWFSQNVYPETSDLVFDGNFHRHPNGVV
jgi:CheY-like chemotaxis protein